MYLSKVLALINEYRKPINLPELRWIKLFVMYVLRTMRGWF
jgi:hypothetical protein